MFSGRDDFRLFQTYQEPASKYKNKNYFQLQSGSELLPDVVNGFWLLPSASMVQICSDPDRFD